ncbi:MAG: ATP-binding cassette domain-containing protein, partial [Microvirga sp.]
MSASADRLLLRLDDAGVRLGSVTALRRVSLLVARGDVIALVGANGSGKTTLLRLLHGLVESSGTRAVGDPLAVQAMVFQRPFMLNMTVWNNLRLALWLARRRVPRSQAPQRAYE